MNLSGPLAAVASYARRTHTASCVITRPGVGDTNFNEETGAVTEPEPITVYDGPCSVLAIGADRVQDFGDGPVVTRTYQVALDGLDDGVETEDDIVFASTADPRIDGLEAVVIDAPGSSLPTNRQLIVEEQVTQQPAGG